MMTTLLILLVAALLGGAAYWLLTRLTAPAFVTIAVTLFVFGLVLLEAPVLGLR
jgi:hypothetical protein